MNQNRLSIDVTLVAPILTHASAAGKIGIDAACAKTADGLCYLPFSLVKGRLRQSWDELGLKDPEGWFGKRRGGWSGARGRFRFSDFVEQPPATGPRSTPEKRRKTGESHRIRIDARTGAADEGALQFLESPFAAGETVTFRGDVTWFEDSASADDTRASVLRAFRCTGSFGGGRTIGFGRVRSVQELRSDQHAMETSRSTEQRDDGPLYAMSIEVLDPFCLARKRIDENLFSSDSVIPGAAVRGVLATTINRLLGRDSATPILPGDAIDTAWNDIADHLNEIRFSHSFPASKASMVRPAVPPLSLVRDRNRRVWDVARCEGPLLLDGTAPDFAIDWKEGDSTVEDVRARLGWPGTNSTIRTRTAIDRDTKRAERGHLFSYEMIDPSNLVWIGRADFSTIADREQRKRVIDQFERIFAMQPAALGKTKARMTIALQPSNEGRSDGNGGDETLGTQKKQWVLTLQTPALLCDSSRLDETSNRDDLFAAYAAAWADLSDGALSLVRFFASQSLTGGYLSHRFARRQQFYAPFLLTDAGSVFVVEGEPSASSLIEQWRRSCLPLPSWARNAYGDTWNENPYLPCDGFGEIAVDLRHYTQPTNAEPIAQWPPIDRNRPVKEPARRDDAAAAADEGLPGASSVRVRHEDVAQGTVKTASVDSLWRMSGRIETTSDLHLGSGGITFRKELEVEEKGAKSGKRRIEVAAVAVDRNEAAYIPGSSIKGALRAWAAHRYDQKLVDSIFGGDSKDASGHAGKAEFHDAMSLPPQRTFEHVPYWMLKRRTGVVASVAIDRWARTAQDKKLFHFEVVPPGVAFDVVVTAQDLDEREAGLLIQALRAFGNARSKVDDPERTTLGAGTNDGLGRFCWEGENVQRLQSAAAWTGDWAALPALDQGVRDGFAAAAVPAGADASLLTVAVEKIQFDGPFLVNEPSLTNKMKEGLPNHAPRVDSKGSVALPASSFRGALRSQAERIARTIGRTVCHGTDPTDACRDEQALCVTCRLFGAVGWASRVRVPGFELANAPQVYDQELVAIDRFTGGASGTAKYKARVAWRPIFRGSIQVPRERIDEEALGLLALTLRDLAEGDVALGFGRSKGFGSCWATIPWLDTAEAKAAVSLFNVATSSDAGTGEKADAVGLPTTSTHGTSPSAASAKPATGDDTFHNPYHFIPIPERPGADCVPRSAFAHDERVRRPKDHEHGRLAHDSYVKGTYSGRIICKIATESPLVIGAERSSSREGTPVVHGFWKDERPYIPATTLRGMLSSIAEAASNSAMRVLADTELTVRAHPAPRRGLGTVHDYFDNAFGPEILPFSPARGAVSMAEQIFGFVEQEATRGSPHRDRPEDGSTNAFAGRVRLSFARGTKWTKGEEKRSRVLDSPGPNYHRPVPSMYFQPTTGAGFIAKDGLAVGSAVPQGRKFYLHHKEPDRQTDWESRNADTPKQKSWLTPLNDAEFWFHVDFENLSRRELALICFALRPSEKFRHKLGLGKSLGLGTIRIDPAATLYIDRYHRYAEPDHARRYSSGCVLPGELPPPYTAEAASAEERPAQSLDGFEALRDEFAGTIHPSIRRALELIGEPEYVTHRVHTPQIPGMDTEKETYKWFVQNEKPGQHQFLTPITAATKTLPTLSRKVTASAAARPAEVHTPTRTTTPVVPAGPPFKREIVNLALDGTSRFIIARNPVSGAVEAQIAADSPWTGVPEAARRLAEGETIRARIRARRDAHGYSIVEITNIENT